MDNADFQVNSCLATIIGIWVVTPLVWAVLALIPALRPVAFLIAFGCGIGAMLYIGYLLDKPLENAITTLANSAQLADVGRLTEVLWVSDRGSSGIRPVVAQTLTRLLPQLQAADAVRLNAEQRAELYKVLKRTSFPWSVSPDYELAVAVLKVVEQFKDVTVLPQVKRLAGEEAIMQSEKRVRAVAQECLAILQAQIEPKKT